MQLLLRSASFCCVWILLPAAFLISWVAFIMAGAIPRGDPAADFTADFGVNEWMIDYSGGFVRRGLFGEVLHFLWDHLSLHPATVAVVLSVAAYIAFCIYAFRSSAKLLPVWCLLTTALVAGPHYTRNVIRKDVTLLLVLVACVKVAQSSMRKSVQCVVLNALLTVGLLLQESFAFFGLPACIVLVGLTHAPTQIGSTSQRLLRAVGRGSLFCLPAVVVLTCLITAHGSPETAKQIHDSWKSAFANPAAWPEKPNGSIMWVGFPPSEAFKVTWEALRQPVFGLPSWMMVAVNALAGALLIRAFFSRYASTLHARVFSAVCGFQFAACLLLFVGALDSGRWLMFVLLSSFVLTIECQRTLSGFFSNDRQKTTGASASKSASWLPIVSVLYGICPVTWSVLAYVIGTPLGALWANWNRLGVLRWFT